MNTKLSSLSCLLALLLVCFVCLFYFITECLHLKMVRAIEYVVLKMIMIMRSHSIAL